MLKTTQRAFTLIELLAVIAILGVLASMVLPATIRAKARATAAPCQNNVRQLQVAWQMYVDDHRGALPDNQSRHDGWRWIGNTNSWAGTTNVVTGSLWPYLMAAAVYRCPGYARLPRTYSMNGNLGGRTGEVQTVVVRYGNIAEPSRLFVFVDEHEGTVDDAHFLVWPVPDDRWVNFPSGRHNQAGVLSFADGHAELWPWLASKRWARDRGTYWMQAKNPHDLSDLRRLQGAALMHITTNNRARKDR